MLRRTQPMAQVVLLAVLAACSGTRGGQPSDPLPRGESVRWTGTIKGAERKSGTVSKNGGAEVFNGSVVLVPDAADPTRSEIRITLSGATTNTMLSWALLPDRCGSGAVPVLPLSSFGFLEMGMNGRAELTKQLPFDFPIGGIYHVAIYAGHRAVLEDVIACANLALRKG